MHIAIGKEVFVVPYISMESMLAKYDAMNVNTADTKAFLRVTELIAMDRAAIDMQYEQAKSAPPDPYKPTRYKRCLRAILRRRSNKKKTVKPVKNEQLQLGLK